MLLRLFAQPRARRTVRLGRCVQAASVFRGHCGDGRGCRLTFLAPTRATDSQIV